MAYTKKTREKIDGLKAEIAKLNREIAERDKTIDELEETIQNLTLKYKYVQFDIEATTREIDYYKKQLRDKDE
jgi:septal ring factor EnvC (AmiA/AmiB activator)